MLQDRDSALITDIKIDKKTCSYSLIVNDSIEELLLLRKDINKYFSKNKSDILKLKQEIGNLISHNDDIGVGLKKKELKQLLKERKEIELSLSDKIKERERLEQNKRKINFSFDIDTIKTNCVCCRELLPDGYDAIINKIKNGNYCQKCSNL